jgi:hypothetical protein
MLTGKDSSYAAHLIHYPPKKLFRPNELPNLSAGMIKSAFQWRNSNATNYLLYIAFNTRFSKLCG